MIASHPSTRTRKARPGGLIGAIFRKEFRETFRERRTIMAVVIGPLLLTPALFALMGSLFGGQAAKAQAHTYAVGLIGPASAPALLRSAPRLRLVPTTRADAERQIGTHRLDAAVLLPPDLEARLTSGDAAPGRDPGRRRGHEARRRRRGSLRALFASAGQAVVAQRVAARGLPPGFAAPFRVSETPIKSGGRDGDAVAVVPAALPAHHLGLQRDDLCRLRPGSRGEGARDTGDAAGLAGLAAGHRAGEVRHGRGRRLPPQQRPDDRWAWGSPSAAACTPSPGWPRAG